MSEVRFLVEFEKAATATTGRFVRGFASVASVNGRPLVDHQGDIISLDELAKAAHRFVTEARVAKAMHAGKQIGDVVESVMIDDEFAKALGVTDPRRGWWVAMEIHDEDVRDQIRKGKLRAFSIGGRGRRSPVEA